MFSVVGLLVEPLEEFPPGVNELALGLNWKECCEGGCGGGAGVLRLLWRLLEDCRKLICSRACSKSRFRAGRLAAGVVADTLAEAECVAFVGSRLSELMLVISVATGDGDAGS